MLEFTVSTDKRLQTIDVTDRVCDAVPQDATGTCTVFVRHTTAAVAVNEGESRLLGDFEEALADLVPDEGWAHDARGGVAATLVEAGEADLPIDDNAASHVRSLLVGPSETIPVEDGALALGTWQSVLLVECDGPRTRTVCVATE